MKRQEFAPVYLLHGEEPYYIEKLVQYFQASVLEEHEREFNQTVLYGRETDAATIVETAKRFPMMASRQVVIVKEARELDSGNRKEFEKLEDYMANPVASTILVLDFKHKKADARKKVTKLIQQVGTVFESSKIYDNELPDFIGSLIGSKKYRINQNAVFLLAEYLGNDLEKIDMEVNKMLITVPISREISVEDVRKNIGVSKEFNVFELQSALAARDHFKSFRIAKFFARNSKNYPIPMITAMLYPFFSRLLLYHYTNPKDDKNLMSVLKIGFMQLKDLKTGAKNHSAVHVVGIISLLREYDARSKGVGNISADDGELLKELVFRILHHQFDLLEA